MVHPFRWAPAESQRHASLDRSPGKGYPEGTVVQTLCGKQLRAETSDVSWLWKTCPDCNIRARELASARARSVPTA